METDAHILREAPVHAGVDRKRIASTADGRTHLGRSGGRSRRYRSRALQCLRHSSSAGRTVPEGFLSTKRFEPNEAAAIDATLTYLYMKYTSDLPTACPISRAPTRPGRSSPGILDPLDRLERALQDNRVAESLAELTPEAPAYRASVRRSRSIGTMPARGGWPTVPADIKLKPGQVSEHVPAVARRLAASGDYTGALPADGQPAAYTTDLQEAVKRFQRRHGLADDAVVGAAVAAEMNVPLDARVRQIELNLERWRWLPRELGDRYILVNIPEMRLDVWEQRQRAV